MTEPEQEVVQGATHEVQEPPHGSVPAQAQHEGDDEEQDGNHQDQLVPTDVVSKRIKSQKLYDIFTRIKSRRSGHEGIGKFKSSKMTPGITVSSENARIHMRVEGHDEQQEDAMIRTPLETPNSSNQHFRGVNRSPETIFNESQSLPLLGSSSAYIRETPEPQQSQNRIKSQSEKNQVLNKGTEEEVDTSSAKGKT